MKIDLSVNLAGIRLKNPVLVASGTFGYGYEIADLVPVAGLGGIITKTITLRPRPGNAPPRLAEVECGMLNTIGLQNVGLERFAAEKWPKVKALGTAVIVSIAGETAREYADIARELNALKGIAALELNLSCPNLQKKIICQSEPMVRDIVRRVAKMSRLPVIAKLSPQVSDLAGLALACRQSGADVLSLVNTFPAMAIDAKTRKPKLSTVTGGLSGPAIKPLALRCVWEVCRTLKAPVIGGGGIMTGEDAVEFMLAGAGAVSVGTANFVDPESPVRIVEGMREYLAAQGIPAIRRIRGKLAV